MVDISRLGVEEVVGTPGPDRFTGRTNTAFFGRQGGDVFTGAQTAPLGFGFDEGQAFFGGRGNDTYVVPTGTSVIVGDGGGSPADVVRATWIREVPTVALAEFDGRHLAAVDVAGGSIVVILDWLDPARRIETFETGEGTFRLGVDVTPADLRALPNYLGNFSLDVAAGEVGGDLVAFTREGIDLLLARSDELDRGAAPPPGPTAGADTLVGTPAADTIAGLGGDDLIRGRAGDDTLIGGAGDDQLFGGGGADLIRGGPGNDILVGGPGADVLRGGGGSDLLRGAGGPDELFGGQGPDTLRGGQGRDELKGGGGADELFGGRGADLLDGKAGPDMLTGGAGPDTFALSVLDGRMDTVTDLVLAEGDVLDVSPLLPGFDAGDAVEDFVQLTPEAAGTTVAVDPTGSGASFTPAALIDGVVVDSLSAAQLGLPEPPAG